MSNVGTWSTTADSNNSASPNGFPENMAPSGVNNSARENMAAIAKQYKDTAGGLVTTGSATAYTLTTNNVHASLGNQGLLVFRIHAANTGAATLNVDGLGARAMQITGAALVAGALPQDSLVIAAYNATNTAYDVFVQSAVFPYTSSNITTTGTLSVGGITTSEDLTFTNDNPVILGGDTDGTLIINAGISVIDGANAVFHGSNKAGTNGDFQLRANAINTLYYDNSDGSWNFQANDIITTGTITGTIATASQTTINRLNANVSFGTGNATLSDGDGTSRISLGTSSNGFTVDNSNGTVRLGSTGGAVISANGSDSDMDVTGTFNLSLGIGVHGQSAPAQAAHIADATDAADVITRVNAILVVLENLGFTASS